MDTSIQQPVEPIRVLVRGYQKLFIQKQKDAIAHIRVQFSLEKE